MEAERRGALCDSARLQPRGDVIFQLRVLAVDAVEFVLEFVNVLPRHHRLAIEPQIDNAPKRENANQQNPEARVVKRDSIERNFIMHILLEHILHHSFRGAEFRTAGARVRGDFSARGPHRVFGEHLQLSRFAEKIFDAAVFE